MPHAPSTGHLTMRLSGYQTIRLSLPKYNRAMPDRSPLVSVRSTRFITLCGRIFHNTDPRYFPRAAFRGRTLYFCTESCLGAFVADPERFYRAHRRSNHKAPLQSK